MALVILVHVHVSVNVSVNVYFFCRLGLDREIIIIIGYLSTFVVKTVC